MAKRLPIPDELQHLIEKRETKDRRGQARRKTTPEATSDAGVSGDTDAPPNPVRRKADRRTSARRKPDGK